MNRRHFSFLNSMSPQWKSPFWILSQSIVSGVIHIDCGFKLIINISWNYFENLRLILLISLVLIDDKIVEQRFVNFGIIAHTHVNIQFLELFLIFLINHFHLETNKKIALVLGTEILLLDLLCTFLKMLLVVGITCWHPHKNYPVFGVGRVLLGQLGKERIEVIWRILYWFIQRGQSMWNVEESFNCVLVYSDIFLRAKLLLVIFGE